MKYWSFSRFRRPTRRCLTHLEWCTNNKQRQQIAVSHLCRLFFSTSSHRPYLFFTLYPYNLLTTIATTLTNSGHHSLALVPVGFLLQHFSTLVNQLAYVHAFCFFCLRIVAPLKKVLRTRPYHVTRKSPLRSTRDLRVNKTIHSSFSCHPQIEHLCSDERL